MAWRWIWLWREIAVLPMCGEAVYWGGCDRRLTLINADPATLLSLPTG
jgi:hypothetical protein